MYEPNEEMAALRAALARVERWFAKHRPRFHAGLPPGAPAEELAGFPEPLRVLLAWHNGQSGDFAGCFQEHWFLMNASEIRAADLDGSEWFAFLDDDAGNYLCLDATQKPAPVRLYSLDDSTGAVVAPSLSAWIQTFAVDLEDGRYTEDPERGTLNRSGD